MRYSRYIIAWKLCTRTKAVDVTDTLELALDAFRNTLTMDTLVSNSP